MYIIITMKQHSLNDRKQIIWIEKCFARVVYSEWVKWSIYTKTMELKERCGPCKKGQHEKVVESKVALRPHYTEPFITPTKSLTD